jgi:aspartyl-tRNA(Asn)/glutamyl-tRNA(Gln) amidotransferase subunit B
MEKGMVRCDVNVSVRPVGTKELGAKIEIKNMNSFSGVRRALEYEIPRQIEVVKKGDKLIQSTRRWDDDAGVTDEMRTKEHAHDYRYFPDPDLMPLAPTDAWLAEVKSRGVELPLARKQRFMRDYQLPANDAEVFKGNTKLGNDFEEAVKNISGEIRGEQRAKLIKTTANLFINNNATLELLFEGPNPFPITERINIAALIQNNTINIAIMQQKLIPEMIRTRQPSAVVVPQFAQVSDTGTIEKFCDEAIAANPNPVADYKAGKVAALNSLKGQVMKLSKGKANPALVGEILEKKLKG